MSTISTNTNANYCCKLRFFIKIVYFYSWDIVNTKKHFIMQMGYHHKRRKEILEVFQNLFYKNLINSKPKESL